MSNYYERITEQNPEVKAAIENAANEAGVQLSLQMITGLTAAIVSCCVTKSFNTALVTSNVGKLTQIGTDASITLYANGTSTALNASIQGSFTVEDAASAIISTLASIGVSTTLTALEITLAPEILMTVGIGFAISAAVNKGINYYMDGRAIAEVTGYEDVRIKSASDLTTFLTERWDQIKDIQEWSLQKADSATGLILSFEKKDEEGHPPMLLVTNQNNFLPDNDATLFETICKKIETDFEYKKEGDLEPDYIYNYTAKTGHWYP